MPKTPSHAKFQFEAGVIKNGMLQQAIVSDFGVYTSSLVPYQDFKTEGLAIMIVESGHIKCAMSHPEVNNYVRHSKIELGSYAEAYYLIICCRLIIDTF